MEDALKPNKMLLNGKDIDPPDAYLEINLCNNNSRVAGFGQPVTAALALQMITDYFADYRAAQNFFKRITEDNEKDWQNDEDFLKLYDLFSPGKHIVSGIFGKEILMQILAQPGCEGIKYMFGKYNGEPTIILMGVVEKEAGSGEEDEVQTEAKAALLGGDIFDECRKSMVHNARGPIIVEVHSVSKTAAQLAAELGIENPDGNDMSQAVQSVY